MLFRSFEGGEEDLARRALRGRERWVYCRSSSSSPSAATATTTSSSCSSAASTGAASARPPLLKLDYDEILAAWAGRGSLYIGAAAGHAAPKLEPDSVSLRSPFVFLGVDKGRYALVNCDTRCLCRCSWRWSRGGRRRRGLRRIRRGGRRA